MISLYVGSTSGYSGKSLVSMGIGIKMKRDGLRVGYFKPVGILPIKVDSILTDKDAWFIYRVFELKDHIAEVCPVVLTQELTLKAYLKDVKGLMKRIEKSFHQLSQDKDIMIVGGSGSIYSWSVMGVSGLKIIKRLNSKSLIVVKYEGEFCVDYILQAKKDLGNNFIGIIFNKVTHELRQSVDDYIVPFLRRKGIDVMGILPHDPLVGSVTVEELNEMLGGKVLCCHNRMNNLVEHFLIGAMQVDRATEYFRTTKNNAVIVGGDRADIQLSAIESGTECLVLTGELYPSELIISRAEQKNIPIIVVRDDTYTVAKKVERLSTRLRLRDKAKVTHGTELVINNVNFPLLYKNLGINVK